MATIKSGATADILTVDPTSKAARISLYDPAGVALNPSYLGSYMARIEAIPTVTTADATLWAMRNTGSRTVLIRRINLVGGWIATTAADSRSLFKLERFSAATPTGGTQVVVVKLANTAGTSSIGDCRFNAGGLTTTGATFEGPMHQVGVNNQKTFSIIQELTFGDDSEAGRFTLAAGEGLALRNYGTIVAGAWLTGSVRWDER